jgi:hypothetical protein
VAQEWRIFLACATKYVVGIARLFAKSGASGAKCHGHAHAYARTRAHGPLRLVISAPLAPLSADCVMMPRACGVAQGFRCATSAPLAPQMRHRCATRSVLTPLPPRAHPTHGRTRCQSRRIAARPRPRLPQPAAPPAGPPSPHGQSGATSLERGCALTAGRSSDCRGSWTARLARCARGCTRLGGRVCHGVRRRTLRRD